MANRSEIEALTGLRGVAAVYVVLYHYLSFGSGTAANVLHHGYLAVDLFFALSGFVMSMTYGREFAVRYSIGGHKKFIVKRLGRVYPIYFVLSAVCIYLAYQQFLPISVNYVIICSNLLLIQSWGLSDSFIGPAWSISSELAAYILFPWLAMLIIYRSWKVSLVMMSISGFLVILVSIASDEAIHEMVGATRREGPLDVHAWGTVYPLLRCISEFTMGIIAWCATGNPRLVRLLSQAWFQWLLAVLIVGLLAAPRTDILIVLLFILLICCLSLPLSSSVGRFFAIKSVHQLGVISYSLYLIHLPIQQLADPIIKTLTITHAHSIIDFLLLGPTIGLATACYYGIEKPCRIWSLRLLEPQSYSMKLRADDAT